MTDDEPADPARPPDSPDGRRRRWGRWVAIGVLVTFGMFVLWNAVTLLVLIYSNLAPNGSGPFGP
jgi:hypothetical protein